MLAKLSFVLGIIISLKAVESHSFRSCDKPKKLLCQNVFVANECGVVEQCIETWDSHKWNRFATDLSVPCISCLAMNATQRQQLVRETCRLLSRNADTTECNTLVEKLKFENRLTKDGNTILCNILSVCNSHTYVGDLNFDVSHCQDCYNTVKMLENIGSSPNVVGTIADKLQTILCVGLPEEYSQICIDNIHAHIPEIFAMAEEKSALKKNCSSSPKAYSWISRPSTRDSFKWTSYAGLSSQNPSCEDCVAVVDAVKVKLNNPMLQEKIKQAIEDAYCRNLKFLEEICENAVKTQFDKAIDKIIHSPSRPFCAAFGMCSAPSAVSEQDPLVIVDPQSYTSLVMPQLPLTNAIPVPGVCHICEMVFEKLIDLVIDEVTEERITAALDQVCKLIPTAYENQCDNLVKQYATQIVEAIIKGATPKVACASLGLCLTKEGPLDDFPATANSLETVHFMGGVMQVIASMQSWDFECALCKTLVSIAYPLLNDSAKMDEVKGQLKKFCTLLPSSYVQQCMVFVDVDFEMLLKYIKEHVPEDKVCSLIGVCPEDTAALCSGSPEFACSSLSAAIKCSAVQLCIALGMSANLVVVDKSICDRLSLSNTCASLELTHSCGKVEKCQLFRLAALLEPLSALPDTGSLVDSSGSNCGQCVNLVDTMALRRKLYGFSYYDKGNCQPTTKTYKACAAVLSRQKEVMNDIISDQFTSLQICKRHSLCEASDADKTNNAQAGVHSCSDGFKYWCSSMEAALACNALNYCKTFGYFSADTVLPDSQHENVDKLGNDACSYGPTYWCQSRDNAEKCGAEALRHCETLVWSPPVVKSTQPLLGQKPCTWGPSFWCASQHNAEMCNKVAYCKSVGRLRGKGN